jgi:site-specific DNA recombinase
MVTTSEEIASNPKRDKVTTAGIYCRVSTDNQEREGTSLQTQLEACLKYCKSKGYIVTHSFSEAYSGLTLERPKLSELRELARNEAVDAIVCYCLDRLTRDPGHGVIITQELEEHGVNLETVTEDVDNSELGKLISYIRGFASKLEAQKIRERSMRGKLARAKEGRIPSGSGCTIYGYDYVRVSKDNAAHRAVNEIETFWVKQIYGWLVNEGLSINAITYRLRASNAPTKFGGVWGRQSVNTILKNPSYAGKTYVFTTSKNGNKLTRPREDWVEIPGVTPAIITPELFEAAQKQLQANSHKSVRNSKYKYLLHGHIWCRQCGHSYYAGFASATYKDKRRIRLYYRCSGKLKMLEPINRCHNKNWNVAELEPMVWAEIENALNHPELIIAELDKQHHGIESLGSLKTELNQTEKQLSGVDREQHQLLQWALKGFPENQVEAENKRLNKSRETLQQHKTEVEAQIKTSQEAVINVPKIEGAIRQLCEQIKDADYATRRSIIEKMEIKVWLDDENMEITGFIPTEKVVIATTLYSSHGHNTNIPFSFKTKV